MIKLIIADMDGTLLNSKKELSKDLFNIIEILNKKDIKFAVASGRQYYNLQYIFEGIDKNIAFISENGSIIFDNQECIYVNELNKESIEEPVNTIRNVKNAFPVLCGVKSAYVEDNNSEFLKNSNMYYRSLEVVPNILDVLKKDKICKIATYDSIGAETNSYPILKKYNDRFLVSLSGENWVDINNNDINKGEAVKILQKQYNIKYDECMAFGDYLNDYEMMKMCKYSYAMSNAHPKLKEICNFEAPSNDEDGVVKVLKKIFEI